ncbi:MAG: cytochrome C [Deltaproteobacteria bacterium]|nr:cytochrome C [Deltaproteobacteria bacterium]
MKMPFSHKNWGSLNELLYNPLSLTGFALVVLSASLYIVATFFSSVSGSHGGAYSGLITFIIMPPLLILGLFLIPIGILWRKRSLHRLGLEKSRFFIIDFNIPRHRQLFLIFTTIVLFVLILISNMSWQAYHFSESVKFCSSCHTVMHPETVTHKLSPHAKVTCAACHVGPGAGWYMRSKLAGLRQVYAVITNSYPRPITTPIHNLRPARDICEQCHWPQYFIDDKIITHDYYQRNDENTHGSVTLQMHVRGNSGYGRPTGIHWHIENIVEFAAVDPKQEDVPWVKVIYRDGREKIFVASDDPISKKKLAMLKIKKMDCITCHNRPSHIFRSPEEIMNLLLTVGRVSPKLTDIRAIGADALASDYKTDAGADRGIAKAIRNGCSNSDPQEVAKAISAIKKAYHQNFFPKMKVRWDVHPSNIGHWRSKGCFRCHDGKHVSKNGEIIPRRCNLCHTILSQKSKDGLRFNINGVPFIHPVDIDGEWKTTNCSQCHKGE